MSVSNTLLPPKEREARRLDRQRAILRWLRDETWSSSDILGLVMGIRSRQGIYKALCSIERDGMIAKAKLSILGERKALVWGITPHGLAYAFDLDERFERRPHFESSKLRVATMNHQLDVQRFRLKAEDLGYSRWVPGARLGRSSPTQKRPDAVAFTPGGLKIAVEVERTIKTYKRYEEILSAYLQSLKCGDLAEVHYVSPTCQFAKRVERVFRSIKTVPVKGQRVVVDPDRHLQPFVFVSYSQWPGRKQDGR